LAGVLSERDLINPCPPAPQVSLPDYLSIWSSVPSHQQRHLQITCRSGHLFLGIKNALPPSASSRSFWFPPSSPRHSLLRFDLRHFDFSPPCTHSRSYAGGSRAIFDCCCTTVYVHHYAGGSRVFFFLLLLYLWSERSSRLPGYYVWVLRVNSELLRLGVKGKLGTSRRFDCSTLTAVVPPCTCTLRHATVTDTTLTTIPSETYVDPPFGRS
jgi:hypothetical protein